MIMSNQQMRSILTSEDDNDLQNLSPSPTLTKCNATPASTPDLAMSGLTCLGTERLKISIY